MPRPTSPSPSRSPARWYFAILLAIACIMAYDPGRSDNSSGDTISARYWPVAILKHHTWKLTPFKNDLAGVGYAAIFDQTSGDWYPRNGWGMALFTVPFYAVADALDWGGREWTHDRVSQVARWNAIAIATASVVALYLLLLHFAPMRVALASAALFAFGTWNWSMATQGLWSQTAAVLTHLLAFHLLWRICAKKPHEKLTGLSVWLALAHVVIWSLRPQDILLAAPVALILRERKALLPYLATAGGATIGLMLAYKAAYGYYLGAYGVIEAIPGTQTWRLNGFKGLFGLLVSPNRGTLEFFPLLLWVPWLWHRYMPSLGLVARVRARFPGARLEPARPAARSASSDLGMPVDFARATGWGAALYFATLCFVVYWHGTWAYGPRYLYDLMPYVWPVLTVMLVDAARWFAGEKHRLSAAALALCLLCGAYGVFIHGLGARNYDLYVWNREVVPVNDEKAWYFSPLMLERVWNAGSNEHRYAPDALKRLKDYGF